MIDAGPRLDPLSCRRRQQRLLDQMHEHRIERAIVASPQHVHWLTGLAPRRLLPAAVSLDADGRCMLSTAAVSDDEPLAVDERVTCDAQWHATLRQERWLDSFERLVAALPRGPIRRLGVEFSQCGSLAVTTGRQREVVDLDPVFWSLRRRKDNDELAMIHHAIGCTGRMYMVAREIIEPGIDELEVYGRLHAVAVDAAGEPLSAFGNDFQCGTMGGLPRRREAQAGELYILDLGPAYRGYYADTCRTFAVDRQPTDLQWRAWEVVVAVLTMIEETARPGTSCRQLFEVAREILDEHLPGRFPHHLGHGIGLEPHEIPHLNPHWDDVLQEGDVFTAEPGLYASTLNAGVRLEQNYRVTADGVERLTSFPLEL